MLLSDAEGVITAETGTFFAPELVNRLVIEAARDLCRFSFALNKSVSGIFASTDSDETKNHAVSLFFTPYTDTEPCGMFGLVVNGYKTAGVERDADSPYGATFVLNHNGGIFYEFSNQTTCLIHPFQNGGDIRGFVAFMPTIAATQLDDGLWGLYGPGIISGVKAKLLMMPGYQTTNPNAATMFANEFIAAKRKARSDVNKRIVGEALCSWI